jgi:hypothetical protein
MVHVRFSLLCGWAQSRLKEPGGRIPLIPDTIKFLLAVGCIVGVAYGAIWGLATFPPEQTEVVRSLPHEKLRQSAP